MSLAGLLCCIRLSSKTESLSGQHVHALLFQNKTWLHAKICCYLSCLTKTWVNLFDFHRILEEEIMSLSARCHHQRCHYNKFFIQAIKYETLPVWYEEHPPYLFLGAGTFQTRRQCVTGVGHAARRAPRVWPHWCFAALMCLPDGPDLTLLITCSSCQTKVLVGCKLHKSRCLACLWWAAPLKHFVTKQNTWHFRCLFSLTAYN